MVCVYLALIKINTPMALSSYCPNSTMLNFEASVLYLTQRYGELSVVHCGINKLHYHNLVSVEQQLNKLMKVRFISYQYDPPGAPSKSVCH